SGCSGRGWRRRTSRLARRAPGGSRSIRTAGSRARPRLRPSSRVQWCSASYLAHPPLPEETGRLHEQHDEEHREGERLAELRGDEVDVLPDEVQEDADEYTADDGANRALQAAEHSSREPVEQ